MALADNQLNNNDSASERTNNMRQRDPRENTVSQMTVETANVGDSSFLLR